MKRRIREELQKLHWCFRRWCAGGRCREFDQAWPCNTARLIYAEEEL